jgi:tyrosyl-tRNA synthetase
MLEYRGKYKFIDKNLKIS